MTRFAILALIALALMYEKSVNSEEIAGSKNFHLSAGMSKSTYKCARMVSTRKVLKSSCNWRIVFFKLNEIQYVREYPTMWRVL